ncbi:hypothetical protein SELMODRAFT_412030 [Selaginella moellendorffii]|uniref:Uncharacterized protein n=1 Tax=Selaginella moellendorffii TaxID=88036 RepID=D8RJU1_SELML|nr:hypothetical protein SELMODRAFT_412030 [Selaginella moellendorffii]
MVKDTNQVELLVLCMCALEVLRGFHRALKTLWKKSLCWKCASILAGLGCEAELLVLKSIFFLEAALNHCLERQLVSGDPNFRHEIAMLVELATEGSGSMAVDVDQAKPRVSQLAHGMVLAFSREADDDLNEAARISGRRALEGAIHELCKLNPSSQESGA